MYAPSRQCRPRRHRDRSVDGRPDVRHPPAEALERVAPVSRRRADGLDSVGGGGRGDRLVRSDGRDVEDDRVVRRG
ncbi:hypothetical protein, partial [Halorubrum sp. SD626R]|uniref:hypothetical protein n=1 Tax=Halorubrum sp. SD626R TaxID=1419722 RepID=UPI001305155C